MISTTRTARRSSVRRKILRWFLTAVGSMLAVVVLAVTTVYLWPLGSAHLTGASAATLSFADARARVEEAVSADVDDPAVVPACRTKALIHPRRTAKAVLMLHGYTDCPVQFDALSKLFYDDGYNVYVPRAPRQGVTDLRAHAGLHADELVDYANDALNATTGLGDEVGVVGISGGAVLATWLAEYRTDTVARLLALSPFYDPAPQQAPAWQLKPLMVLYSNRLVPDHFNSAGFSYAALAQYLRIARKFRDRPVTHKLSSIAVVVSDDDHYIDRASAVSITSDVAKTNDLTLGRFEIPASWNIGHDIADSTGLGTHAAELDRAYLRLYEGSATAAP